MNDDTEVSDPLSRAIAEFREELVVWINTELGRLQQWDEDENLVLEDGSAAPVSTGSSQEAGSGVGSRASRLWARLVRADPPSAMGWEPHRNGQRVAVGDAAKESGWSSATVPGPETEPKPQASPLDSRQRLDALARLLDHRLKQAQGAEGTKNEKDSVVGGEAP
jgi:hypothetical protein